MLCTCYTCKGVRFEAKSKCHFYGRFLDFTRIREPNVYEIERERKPRESRRELYIRGCTSEAPFHIHALPFKSFGGYVIRLYDNVVRTEGISSPFSSVKCNVYICLYQYAT